MTTYEAVQEKVQRTMAAAGFADVTARMDADGTLRIDGEPFARVQAAAEYMVKGGARIEKLFNGDTSADEDYHGWGFARIAVA